MGKCITCGKHFHFSELDGGHFIQRQHLATRWDPRNVKAQCKRDNRFLYGLQYEFSLALGSELSEELLIKSKQIFKKTDAEYLEIFEEYRDKLAELKSIQDF